MESDRNTWRRGPWASWPVCVCGTRGSGTRTTGTWDRAAGVTAGHWGNTREKKILRVEEWNVEHALCETERPGFD